MNHETDRDWSGRTVAVIGLGRTGRAAVRLLGRLGARAVVTDDAPASLPAEALAEVRDLGGSFLEPEERRGMWEGADLCVTSPGVPWDSPILEEARSRSIEVISELELASRFVRGHVLAVTGTNGKSTVTELAAHLLSSCGLEALAGGNLGRPLSSMLQEDTEDIYHVVECSSFQLMGCTTFRPEVSVLLNITPDHLDYHGTMEAYAEAKTRIFRRQGPAQVLVYNAGDPRVAALAADAPASRLPFRLEGRPDGADCCFWAEENAIWTLRGGEAMVWCGLDAIPLPGTHNVENVMAAAAAVTSLGCPLDCVRNALSSFRALPHRMERVAECDGVLFVDDSKATNLAAARRAVLSWPSGLHLILGGRDKGADWAGFRDDLEGRVSGLYLLGEAAADIAAAMEGVAPLHRCAAIEEAVGTAWEKARPGDVVLLAPGCASQDMFRDYIERGERFAAAARRIAGPGAAGAGGAG